MVLWLNASVCQLPSVAAQWIEDVLDGISLVVLVLLNHFQIQVLNNFYRMEIYDEL